MGRKIMGIVLWSLLGLIIIIGAVVVIRTLIYKFPEKNSQPGGTILTQDEWFPSEEVLRRFSGGIKIPTVSNQDYEDTDFAPFEKFIEYIGETYAEVYENTEHRIINEYGMVFRWAGRDSSKEPILLLSHYDVVPVVGYNPADYIDEMEIFNPGDEAENREITDNADWRFGPFSGAVAKGRVWGRGTLDMKGMLFGIMEAVNSLMMEGFVPERDVWIAFGQDEEVGGLHGAVHIAEFFKEKGIRFDAVYDEGGIIDANGLGQVDSPIALIGIGEKGFLTARINVYGQGGHSSMPPAKGSLVQAAEIIEKLNNNQLKARMIAPTEAFLETVGAQQSFLTRMVLANRWLFGPVLFKQLSASQQSNALIRTTTAVTMARGSDAANVLSSVSVITVNFRILPGESVADIIKHIEDLCEGYEVKIENVNSREPSGISAQETRGYNAVRNTILKLYPDALVTSYITIGGTDAYKYQIVSDNIYRFMPVSLDGDEQKSIHNENESITIENYGKMIAYFRELIRDYENN